MGGERLTHTSLGQRIVRSSPSFHIQRYSVRKSFCVAVFAIYLSACEDKPLVEQAPLSPVVVEQPAPASPVVEAEAGDAGKAE